MTRGSYFCSDVQRGPSSGRRALVLSELLLFDRAFFQDDGNNHSPPYSAILTKCHLGRKLPSSSILSIPQSPLPDFLLFSFSPQQAVDCISPSIRSEGLLEPSSPAPLFLLLRTRSDILQFLQTMLSPSISVITVPKLQQMLFKRGGIAVCQYNFIWKGKWGPCLAT